MDKSAKMIYNKQRGDSMFGQIIKKVLSCLFFNIVYAIFLLVVAYVWGLITKAAGINQASNWNYVLIFVVTLLIELLAVYFIRIDNKDRKEEYEKKYKKGTAIPFEYDFWLAIRSKDSMIHAVTFNLLLSPIFIMIGIGNQFPTGHVILGTAILFLVGFLLFSIINTLLWCIVHKRWLSTKPPKDFEKMWNTILNRLKGK